VGGVAVDAIEWGERAGFHDDAVEGGGGVGGCGVIDGGGRMNGRDARSTIFGFLGHSLIRSIGSVIRSRSIVADAG